MTSSTVKAAMTINNDTATAASRLPTLNSRNTVVDITSVRIRVAPAKTRIGPNSPSERAHARVAAVSTPRRASGKTTSQKAWLREQPSVSATCSPRGSIGLNVTSIVRTANAQATAVNGLVAAGILEVEGNRVRLISPENLPADWAPETDRRLTVWEMTHHLLRIYYHQKQGDAATAALLRKLGRKADVARDLAYKLFTVCEKQKRSAEAQGYNALVLGWPELLRLAQERPAATTPTQEKLL